MGLHHNRRRGRQRIPQHPCECSGERRGKRPLDVPVPGLAVRRPQQHRRPRSTGECPRAFRIAHGNHEPRACRGAGQHAGRDRHERRAVAPASRLRLDEHLHRHSRDVAECAGEEARFPVGRRGEDDGRGREADVDRKETAVVSGLGVADTIQANLEHRPSGIRDSGYGKRDIGGECPAVGQRHSLRCQPTFSDTHRYGCIPSP